MINSIDSSFLNVVESRSGVSFFVTIAIRASWEINITGKTAYYRFHGLTKFYYSASNEITLQKIPDALLKQKTVKELSCYFNKTAVVGLYKMVYS